MDFSREDFLKARQEINTLDLYVRQPIACRIVQADFTKCFLEENRMPLIVVPELADRGKKEDVLRNPILYVSRGWAILKANRSLYVDFRLESDSTPGENIDDDFDAIIAQAQKSDQENKREFRRILRILWDACFVSIGTNPMRAEKTRVPVQVRANYPHGFPDSDSSIKKRPFVRLPSWFPD